MFVNMWRSLLRVDQIGKVHEFLFEHRVGDFRGEDPDLRCERSAVLPPQAIHISRCRSLNHSKAAGAENNANDPRNEPDVIQNLTAK
jgi:hypothetical protein